MRAGFLNPALIESLLVVVSRKLASVMWQWQCVTKLKVLALKNVVCTLKKPNLPEIQEKMYIHKIYLRSLSGMTWALCGFLMSAVRDLTILIAACLAF